MAMESSSESGQHSRAAPSAAGAPAPDWASMSSSEMPSEWSGSFRAYQPPSSQPSPESGKGDEQSMRRADSREPSILEEPSPCGGEPPPPSAGTAQAKPKPKGDSCPCCFGCFAWCFSCFLVCCTDRLA